MDTLALHGIAAAALMREGAGATQIAAFVSSLMMVGIVTLPMEMKYFGKRAAILRNPWPGCSRSQPPFSWDGR
jgi:hypothetical protein